MFCHSEMSYDTCYTTVPVCSYYCSYRSGQRALNGRTDNRRSPTGILSSIPSSSQSDVTLVLSVSSKLRNATLLLFFIALGNDDFKRKVSNAQEKVQGMLKAEFMKWLFRFGNNNSKREINLFSRWRVTRYPKATSTPLELWKYANFTKPVFVLFSITE